MGCVRDHRDGSQGRYSASHFSSFEYAALPLDYIRVVNPYLEAVMETNPDAIRIAQQLDEERKDGKVRGPLRWRPGPRQGQHGDGRFHTTTAGSWALLGSIVPKDAFVVAKLREAGAVILGHSNMCEWASVRSRVESMGFSTRGGQTRNPYNLENPVRLQFRLRSIHLGQRRPHRPGNGDECVHHRPGRDQQHRRRQTYCGAHVAEWCCPDQRESGFRGAVREEPWRTRAACLDAIIGADNDDIHEHLQTSPALSHTRPTSLTGAALPRRLTSVFP